MESKNSQIRQFPIGWEVKKLKDVCTNSGEYGANAPALPYTEGSIRYIRITDIDDHGQLVSDDKVSLDETVAQNYLLSHDDILFARTGDTVGKSLLYKTEMGKAAYAGYLIKFSFDKKQIIPDYFNAIAKSEIFDAFIVSMKRIGAKPNINSREYGIFKFPLPKDLQMQSAIANILSKVDDAIVSVQNSIAAAERLKKSLMQNLLTGRMKPDGTFRTPEEFYIDDKFGKVPVGWDCDRFKQFAVLQRGNDLTDSEVVPGNYPVIKSNGFSIWHNQYFVEPPGVVTGRSGTIGKVFYIEEKFWAHNTTLYVKDFKGNVPKYIYYLILSMDFSRYFAGTTVPTLNRNDIHKLKIAIPNSRTEQQKIVSEIDAIVNTIQQKRQKIDTLEYLKKSLMQNLLTGKIKINN